MYMYSFIVTCPTIHLYAENTEIRCGLVESDLWSLRQASELRAIISDIIADKKRTKGRRSRIG